MCTRRGGVLGAFSTHPWPFGTGESGGYDATERSGIAVAHAGALTSAAARGAPQRRATARARAGGRSAVVNDSDPVGDQRAGPWPCDSGADGHREAQMGKSPEGDDRRSAVHTGVADWSQWSIVEIPPVKAMVGGATTPLHR